MFITVIWLSLILDIAFWPIHDLLDAVIGI